MHGVEELYILKLKFETFFAFSQPVATKDIKVF